MPNSTLPIPGIDGCYVSTICLINPFVYYTIRCRAETALQIERNIHLFYVKLKE